MSVLDPTQRPHYVQVVTDIPLTTWSRPRWRSLQGADLMRPGAAEAAWRLGADGEGYEPLVSSRHGPASSTAPQWPADTAEDGEAVRAPAHARRRQRGAL